MITLIAFIVALGILVFIHESGHFLLAKKLGIGVEKFSLGFGPKLIGKTVGETEYLLSALPLGGYVKLVGEDPTEECCDTEKSFSAKPVWKRFLVVFAGPFFNFILAIFIFTIIFMIGVSSLTTTISEVQEGSAAMKAGLKTGDIVKAINSRDVDRWSEVKMIVGTTKPGELLAFTVERDGEPVIIDVSPAMEKFMDSMGKEREEARIGISPTVTSERYNPAMAMIKGVEESMDMTKLIFFGISKMISGDISAKEIGGPIQIAQMSGAYVKMGFVSYLSFLAFLSVNLGILNLLPIPVLDGGHLFFFAIEAVLKRPLPERIQSAAQYVGMFLLLTLMLFATYNDLTRWFLE